MKSDLAWLKIIRRRGVSDLCYFVVWGRNKIRTLERLNKALRGAGLFGSKGLYWVKNP